MNKKGEIENQHNNQGRETVLIFDQIFTNNFFKSGNVWRLMGMKNLPHS